jgi:hypothetical protein
MNAGEERGHGSERETAFLVAIPGGRHHVCDYPFFSPAAVCCGELFGVCSGGTNPLELNNANFRWKGEGKWHF